MASQIFKIQATVVRGIKVKAVNVFRRNCEERKKLLIFGIRKVGRDVKITSHMTLELWNKQGNMQLL